MEQFYKCEPSVKVKVLSLLVSLLLVLIAWKIVSRGELHILSLLGLLLLFTIFIGTLAYSPRKLALYEENITLYCFLTKKVFYYADIEKVDRLYVVGGIRRFNSNGVFGYIGVLDGDERYYTLFNHERRMIEIVCRNKHFVISCTQPDDLVEKIKYKLETLACR